MRIVSFLDDHVRDFEVCDPESCTIPDQSLSVRDIITRFTRGQIDIPPIETGSDDDIDSDLSFDDPVDAMDAFERGVDHINSLRYHSDQPQPSSQPSPQPSPQPSSQPSSQPSD